MKSLLFVATCIVVITGSNAEPPKVLNRREINSANKISQRIGYIMGTYLLPDPKTQKIHLTKNQKEEVDILVQQARELDQDIINAWIPAAEYSWDKSVPVDVKDKELMTELRRTADELDRLQRRMKVKNQDIASFEGPEADELRQKLAESEKATKTSWLKELESLDAEHAAIVAPLETQKAALKTIYNDIQTNEKKPKQNDIDKRKKDRDDKYLPAIAKIEEEIAQIEADFVKDEAASYAKQADARNQQSALDHDTIVADAKAERAHLKNKKKDKIHYKNLEKKRLMDEHNELVKEHQEDEKRLNRDFKPRLDRAKKNIQSKQSEFTKPEHDLAEKKNPANKRYDDAIHKHREDTLALLNKNNIVMEKELDEKVRRLDKALKEHRQAIEDARAADDAVFRKSVNNAMLRVHLLREQIFLLGDRLRVFKANHAVKGIDWNQDPRSDNLPFLLGMTVTDLLDGKDATPLEPLDPEPGVPSDYATFAINKMRLMAPISYRIAKEHLSNKKGEDGEGPLSNERVIMAWETFLEKDYLDPKTVAIDKKGLLVDQAEYWHKNSQKLEEDEKKKFEQMMADTAVAEGPGKDSDDENAEDDPETVRFLATVMDNARKRIAKMDGKKDEIRDKKGDNY